MNVKSAFTLVELLVVIAIIAMLASIAIPNLIRARIIAFEATAQATLKTISNAFENYLTANSRYPDDPSLILGGTPSYIGKDYFTGTHYGYTYTGMLSDTAYSITANPASSTAGKSSFTITTGSILTRNP